MKLKDIKDKDGKGLLPEKVKDIEQHPMMGCSYYNKVLSEIGEKELVVDVWNIVQTLNRYLSIRASFDSKGILLLAQTIAKEFPIRVEEKQWKSGIKLP